MRPGACFRSPTLHRRIGFDRLRSVDPQDPDPDVLAGIQTDIGSVAVDDPDHLARRRRRGIGDRCDQLANSDRSPDTGPDDRERNCALLAGEDKYLLPRDKGPVRAYVRDFIDARRNLVGLFMPLALILIMTMFVTPALQQIVTLAMLVMMLFMVGEGIWLGRMINNRVAERFPDSTDGGFKLGWYAFVRASQIRKLRAPKPRVGPGDAI